MDSTEWKGVSVLSDPEIKVVERKSYIGQKIGRLYVLRRSDDYLCSNGKRIVQYVCLCDCGNQTIVKKPQISSGKTKSCGCIQREKIASLKTTHGLSNKCGRLYPLWKSIKYRCYCETSRDYKRYGGRGIAMCDEWKHDFKSFYEWAIANGYKDEKTEKGLNILTIDRIDVDGNYCPENCRFVTNLVQARNKRNTLSNEERYVVCPVCGKTYEKKQRKGANTCSRSCARKLYIYNHPNKKDYIKICPVCSKEYNAKRGGHFNDAIYCSIKCKNISNSPVWMYGGEAHRVIEWADITGINAHCLLHRKNELGWDIEKTLTTPLRGDKVEKFQLQKNVCN